MNAEKTGRRASCVYCTLLRHALHNIVRLVNAAVGRRTSTIMWTILSIACSSKQSAPVLDDLGRMKPGESGHLERLRVVC
jgi:hypothetical protein